MKLVFDREQFELELFVAAYSFVTTFLGITNHESPHSKEVHDMCKEYARDHTDKLIKTNRETSCRE